MTEPTSNPTAEGQLTEADLEVADRAAATSEADTEAEIGAETGVEGDVTGSE